MHVNIGVGAGITALRCKQLPHGPCDKFDIFSLSFNLWAAAGCFDFYNG